MITHRMKVPLIVPVLMALCTTSSSASAWGNVPLGSKIPELTLPSTTGKKVKISARSSKTLVILYIRPNHQRSASALEDLIQLYGKYKSKGLKAIAVSTVRTDAGAIKQLAKKLKVPFPVLIDSDETFYGKYGVFIHPVTGVVDPKGVLRYEYSSHRQGYTIAVERQIRAVLGIGPPPEQIKDVDRQAISSEDRKKHRKSKMELVKQRMELKRAERRLLASRAVLDPENLQTVFKLYGKWAKLLPPPKNDTLAILAEQMSSGDKVQAAVTQLRKLVKASGFKDEARLWLGRALAQQKKPEALKVLEQCAGMQDKTGGLCAFELARIIAATDAKKAVSLCEAAFKRIFGEE